MTESRSCNTSSNSKEINLASAAAESNSLLIPKSDINSPRVSVGPLGKDTLENANFSKFSSQIDMHGCLVFVVGLTMSPEYASQSILSLLLLFLFDSQVEDAAAEDTAPTSLPNKSSSPPLSSAATRILTPPPAKRRSVVNTADAT
ncbi:hypothetical protein ACHAXS_002478 [Conticribra weissflogii]